MGKGMYSYNVTVVDTFRHNNAVYHISFFPPTSLSRAPGKIIYKVLFGAPGLNQV